MPIIPLSDRLVIKPIILEPYGTTKSGIILNIAPVVSDRAKVLSVGAGVKDIMTGDVISYDKNQAVPLTMDNEDVFILRETAVFGKVIDADTN